MKKDDCLLSIPDTFNNNVTCFLLGYQTVYLVPMADCNHLEGGSDRWNPSILIAMMKIKYVGT